MKMKTALLKFGLPNSKLKKLAKKLKLKLKTFSLPSGWTCGGAKECFSRADRETGKIKDGKHTKFRCFQASAEALYPSLRKMVWHNMDLIDNIIRDHKKECKWEPIADLICESLPKADIYRVHVGGDYFNYDYMIAWCEVARRYPDRIFLLLHKEPSPMDKVSKLHGWNSRRNTTQFDFNCIAWWTF